MKQSIITGAETSAALKYETKQHIFSQSIESYRSQGFIETRGIVFTEYTSLMASTFEFQCRKHNNQCMEHTKNYTGLSQQIFKLYNSVIAGNTQCNYSTSSKEVFVKKKINGVYIKKKK